MEDKQEIKDENGAIERIARKPKKTYDKDLLEQELKKQGLPAEQIKSIIKASSKTTHVSEYLSVKPKKQK